MITALDQQFMDMAVQEARKGMEAGSGGPFGCVIVRNGEVLAVAHNEVLQSTDPTAHAEVVAIRKACAQINDFQLTGCIIYASCEPCPMCMGAIYWARPEKLIYGASRLDAAHAGFDDSYIYEEINIAHANRSIPFLHQPSSAAEDLLKHWQDKTDKTHY